MITQVLGAIGEISNITTFLEKITEIGKEMRIGIQCVDAKLVFSKLHVISAVEHAVRSFENNQNATSSLPLEVLLYMAAERQIQRAIEKMGIKSNTKQVVLICIAEISTIPGYNGKISKKNIDAIVEKIGLIRDDSVITGDESTLFQFGITKNELANVTPEQYDGLILEKVAMVDLIKR